MRGKESLKFWLLGLGAGRLSRDFNALSLLAEGGGGEEKQRGREGKEEAVEEEKEKKKKETVAGRDGLRCDAVEERHHLGRAERPDRVPESVLVEERSGILEPGVADSSILSVRARSRRRRYCFASAGFFLCC